MKRYTRNSKQNNTILMLCLGVAIGVYLWSSKASAGLNFFTATTSPSQRDYDNVKSRIQVVQTQDGATPSASSLDAMTQAYIRGDKTEITGFVNALRGVSQTNTAGFFASRLDFLNGNVAAGAANGGTASLAPIPTFTGAATAAQGYGFDW